MIEADAAGQRMPGRHRAESRRSRPLTRGNEGRDEAFREFVAARADAIRFTAYLLCGDWHEAEDIAQTALVRLYLAWHRLDRERSLDAYVRRVVTRTFLNERRRPWHRREHPTDSPPDTRAAPPPVPEERLVLWAALSEVPRRQRAALVLRYWEDLSVEETAELLGCSVGNVKSQCSRGLRTLRGLLEHQSAEGG
jgi:RNA polymerase sigma-70 factor (sigma-E family)